MDRDAMDRTNQFDGLVHYIDRRLDQLEPPPSPELCIYRVPEKLRKVNKEAYTPHVVSIGPFHHGNEKLKSMEEVKMRYLKKLVRRNSDKFSLKSYVKLVKEQEGKIRQCYSEQIGMKSDQFVTMILIDSCFIIELLLNSYATTWRDKDHFPLFSVPWVLNNIRVDLMLLENQVPFFVLKELFRLANPTSFETSFLLDLSLRFFENSNKQQKNRNDIQSVKHFTDLVLTLYQPPANESRPPRGKESFISIFSCTELNESGVTFKAGESKCLFKINFTNDVLEIPNFLLDDNTETLFRNLMALELYRYPNKSCVTDYVFFMDCLINTTRDVNLLVRKKIIDNLLGDNNAAADLFNRLCIEVVFDDANFYFSKVSEDLNAFYKVPWHTRKAILKHEYFKTPWRAASTIAAITLLALTLIQTVCSIVSTARSN